MLILSLLKSKKLVKTEGKLMIEEFEVNLQAMHNLCSENVQLVEQANQEQTKGGKWTRIKENIEEGIGKLSIVIISIPYTIVFYSHQGQS